MLQGWVNDKHGALKKHAIRLLQVSVRPDGESSEPALIGEPPGIYDAILESSAQLTSKVLNSFARSV